MSNDRFTEYAASLNILLVSTLRQKLITNKNIKNSLIKFELE